MLKIGIIGSGFGLYGLLPAFKSIPACTVVALSGRKREQLVSYCESIGFTNIYSDWQHMLEQENIDAVAIAVTPHAQYQIAKVAIAKGLHVFAEKPLAATVQQATELVEMAEKKQIVHGIDFLFPEIAEWQKVKKLIDTKALGNVQHISTRWDFVSYDIKNNINTWKTNPEEGGGALAFYFSHGLHYLEHFAGTITALKCVRTYAPESLGGAEVEANMLLQFAHGITGDAHICCNNRKQTGHRLMFRCERGDILLQSDGGVVDNFIVETSVKGKKERVTVKKDLGQKNEDERVKIVRKLAERFVHACLEQKQMSPNFNDGLRVQTLLDLARNS